MAVHDLPIHTDSRYFDLPQVGGSSGHDAILLAQAFPDLTLIVQDQPEFKSKFQAILPAQLASRVTFEGHDFFQPQTRKADVYCLKTIFHDWPDKYSVQILRNLLPTLNPGGRIVICDVVVPPPMYDDKGNHVLPRMVRRFQGGSDMAMMAFFNSKERRLEDWVKLLKQADNRFQVANVSVTPGALWSVMEIVVRE